MVEGSYNVYVATFDKNKNVNVDFNSVLLTIIYTYGYMNQFRAHAVIAANRLKAGERGHLELTYFLRKELPYTTDASGSTNPQGKFVIEMFP